jgi:hypothetical protein
MSFTIPRKPTSTEQRALGPAQHSTTRTSNRHNNHYSDPNELPFEDYELDLRLRLISTPSAQDATSLNVSISDSSTRYPPKNAPERGPPLPSSNLHETPRQHRPALRYPALESTLGGKNWQTTTFICAMLAAGLLLSLGHHFYYQALSGHTAGDAAKQAWPLRFGTAFSFLVCSTCQATTAAAFQQYVWIVVRKRSLTICR